MYDIYIRYCYFDNILDILEEKSSRLNIFTADLSCLIFHTNVLTG